MRAVLWVKHDRGHCAGTAFDGVIPWRADNPLAECPFANMRHRKRSAGVSPAGRYVPDA